MPGLDTKSIQMPIGLMTINRLSLLLLFQEPVKITIYNKKHLKKCWVHSPQRAASRPFSICR